MCFCIFSFRARFDYYNTFLFYFLFFFLYIKKRKGMTRFVRAASTRVWWCLCQGRQSKSNVNTSLYVCIGKYKRVKDDLQSNTFPVICIVSLSIIIFVAVSLSFNAFTPMFSAFTSAFSAASCAGCVCLYAAVNPDRITGMRCAVRKRGCANYDKEQI